MQAFERLEVAWAEWNGLDPAGMVACASGTAALHLAFESMKDRNLGKTVLLGDFNMVACPRAVAAASLEPVFVDCSADLNLDPELVHEWVWDVKNNAHGMGYAILATHVYGRRCSMDWLAASASDVGMYIVEDLAEAHGVRPHPQTDAACWSFYKNKVVAGEEGGAVWFRDPQHAKLARSLRSLGFTDEHDFWHRPNGWNHRMSNAHAELVLNSMGWYNGVAPWHSGIIEQKLEQRRAIEALYDARCPKEWWMPARDVVWIYDLCFPRWKRGKEILDRAVAACKAVGVEARHSFKPMSWQEEFRGCRKVLGNRGLTKEVLEMGVTHNLAGEMSGRVLYLPCTPGLVDEAYVERAFAAIEGALKK